MKVLSNAKLRPEHIPDPEGDLRDWDQFAHSIDGYEAAGSFEACAALANDHTAESLTELRCALFFQSRAMRHSGGFGCEESVIRDLLRRIKAKVEQGDLG